MLQNAWGSYVHQRRIQECYVSERSQFEAGDVSLFAKLYYAQTCILQYSLFMKFFPTFLQLKKSYGPALFVRSLVGPSFIISLKGRKLSFVAFIV